MYIFSLSRSYYLFIFLFVLLSACSNGNSSDSNVNSESSNSSSDPGSTPTYSDSLLISEEKPTDTIDYTEDAEDTKEDFTLPEEKVFDKFYKEVTVALHKGNATAINKFIHPKWGIYIIDRPGAIDKIDTAKNIETFYRKIYLGEKRLTGMQCKPEHRPIPEITCDKEYEGCLAEKTDNYHRITDLKKGLLEYGFKDNYLPKDDKTITEFEKLIKRNTVNFDKAVGLSFLFIDGKWYIGVIDLAKYSCSA